MTLPVRMRSSNNRRPACRIEVQLHSIVEYSPLLDEIGQSAAADLSSVFGIVPTHFEVVPIRPLQAEIHGLLKLATVVAESRCCRVGKTVRTDKIAPTNLDRIDSNLSCCLIEKALDEIGSF